MGLRSKWFPLALLLSAGACQRTAPADSVIEGQAGGVDFRVRLAKSLSDAERSAVTTAVSAALERVAESSRLRVPGAGAKAPLSPDALSILQEAVRVSELTSGALDVRLVAGTALRDLTLDDDSMTIAARTPADLDLSPLARSYGLDVAALELEELGYRDYLIEAGPVVRSHGRNSRDEAWRAAIHKAGGARGEVQREVPLSGFSLATASSDEDGGLLSVTVLGDSCLTTDALAAGLLVLGAEEGFRLAVDQDLAAVFLVRGEGGSLQERATPAFTELYG
jgi:thiamine biosynthesis lipoprotein ApbE